jgi:hypothetical protein
MSNYLTIFSNGMAHFTRHLPPVKEKTTVQIPVKRTSLADALATLAFFGNVQITEPASYPVTDADKVLTIDPRNVTQDLATKLSGSKVEIIERDGPTTKGNLLGIQPYEERVGDAVVERFRVAIYDEANAYRSFNDEVSIKFLDATVQQEIKKALERNFSAINPESTNVSIGIAPEGKAEGEVIYQLTIPFSAWQPVYQLRLKKGECEIECSAKVDNPTDEDLNDYIVSVATGDPNTFETDLADVRKPRRQRVNIISDTATGAVGAQEDIPQWNAEAAVASLDDSGGAPEALRGRGAVAKRQFAGGVMPAAAPAPAQPRAAQAGATATDVGDFAIYTSKNPVNIGRKRSAVLPLFQSKAKGEALLLYKEPDNPKRPFRAVKFTNTTEYSLGKGSCTVYLDDCYQGQVVLEATKPGQDRVLPHATENGVTVFINPPGSNAGTTASRRARIEITKGTVVIDNVNTHEKVYRFVNNKPEGFNLEIEHNRVIGDARTTFEVRGNTGNTTALDNGLRIPCKLPAKGAGGAGQLEVRVRETQPVSQTVVLYHNTVNNFQWFLRTVIEVDNPPEKLLKSKKIIAVIDLYEKLLKTQEELQEGQQEVQVLSREQARKLELVSKSGGSGTQVDTWRQELAANETELKKQEREKVPALTKAVKAAEDALTEALKALSVSWVEGDNVEDRQ